MVSQTPANTTNRIYTALYAMPRGGLRAAILALLPRGHKTRRPRSAGADRRGLIPDATSIDERPIEVDALLVPGHWEGDLIKDVRNKSQIGTLVERTTLFTVLVQLNNATAERFASVLRAQGRLRRLSGFGGHLRFGWGRRWSRAGGGFALCRAGRLCAVRSCSLRSRFDFDFRRGVGGRARCGVGDLGVGACVARGGAGVRRFACIGRG